MNKLILLISSVFLFSLISANVVITPSPLDATVQVNHEKNFSITIRNNYTFDILDFSFSGLKEKGFVFPSMTIPKNTSATYSIKVKTNQSYHGTIASLVEFKFYVDLPEGTSTHTIRISEYGFNSSYNTIRDGDTIVWTNTDTLTHDIYSAHFGTISIAPNQTQSYTFHTIGSFSYYDLDFVDFNEFQGIIEVVNKTSKQKAHNPNYDITWNVNLNSVLDETIINAENSQSSFNIEYGQFKKGLLTITNTGTTKAEEINLSSDSEWIAFDENNFDLSPGSTEWVEYTIFPNMMATEGTNKTYNKTISLKAYNSNQKNISISIFIPYKEISGELGGDQATMEYYSVIFCPKNPCAMICSALLGYPICDYSSNSSSSSTNSSITANITSKDFYDITRAIKETRDQLNRETNARKSSEDADRLYREEIQRIANESLVIQKENEKKEKERNNITWIIAFGIVLLSSTLYVINELNKKEERFAGIRRFVRYRGYDD
jgi:plastocyanin